MQLPQWKCPDADLLDAMSAEQRSQLWQPRVNELLGALAVASVIQLLLGATGRRWHRAVLTYSYCWESPVGDGTARY